MPLRRSCKMALPHETTTTGGVFLRPTVLTDEAVILEWQRHPETRRYFHTSRAPEREEHSGWMRKTLADPNVLLHIIAHAGAAAGILRLDRCGNGGEGGDAYLVSILVDPEKHNQGIGSAALALARRMLPEAEFRAEVRPGNAASDRLFDKAGYRKGNPRISLPAGLSKGEA